MCYDMAHVLAVYPRLGGLETVFHHVSFATAALVAGVSRAFPFAFGWCGAPAARARTALTHPLQADAVRAEHALPEPALALQVSKEWGGGANALRGRAALTPPRAGR